MDSEEIDPVLAAKQVLERLFLRWNSSFKHRITLHQAQDEHVEFNVAFSRCTDEQPIPGTIVNVLFSIDTPSHQQPKISFQIEGEQYLYKIPDNQGSKNIDQLIISNLEFKQRLRDAFTPHIASYHNPTLSTRSKYMQNPE